MRARQGGKGPAAGASVESAVLRRSRHADRHRRHLVLPQDADRAAGAGQAVRFRAQARGRQVFPGHAGGEVRHHRGRCAVPGGGDEGRGRARNGRVLHFRTNVDDWVACGPEHALRFEPEPDTGGLKPYLHVRRDLWAKVTRALVLRSGRAWRGARRRRRADVRRRLGRRILRDGAGRQLEGIRLMQPGVPLDEVKAPTHEFFERAKARLNREVTPALTDFDAPVRIRGDLDLDPVLWEKAGVKATGPRPCWCRWWRGRSRGAADAAHARTQEPFRADRVSRRQASIRPTRARRRRRCARRTRRSGSTRNSSSRSAISIST